MINELYDILESMEPCWEKAPTIPEQPVVQNPGVNDKEPELDKEDDTVVDPEKVHPDKEPSGMEPVSGKETEQDVKESEKPEYDLEGAKEAIDYAQSLIASAESPDRDAVIRSVQEEYDLSPQEASIVVDQARKGMLEKGTLKLPDSLDPLRLCDDCCCTFRSKTRECTECQSKNTFSLLENEEDIQADLDDITDEVAMQVLDTGGTIHPGKLKNLRLQVEEFLKGIGYDIDKHNPEDVIQAIVNTLHTYESKVTEKSEDVEDALTDIVIDVGMEIGGDPEDLKAKVKSFLDHMDFSYDKDDVGEVTQAIISTLKTYQESRAKKLKEQDMTPHLRVVARGLEDRRDAEQIAQSKNGRVATDDRDEEKFMVVVDAS